MDPNEALAHVRDYAQERLDIEEQSDPELQDPELVEFCETVLALDSWLTTGGFLPADWTPDTRAE